MYEYQYYKQLRLFVHDEWKKPYSSTINKNVVR